MKNKKILVYGGAGVLGKSIIKSLIKNNFLNVYSGDIVECDVKGVKSLKINIFNKEEVFSSILGKDIVINCTGQITKPINNCFEQNTKGISNIISVLNENRNVYFIQISSVNVLGTIFTEANENSIINPETPYSTSKAFAEFLINENLMSNKSSIIRLSNLYGENLSKGVVSYLINSFNAGNVLSFNNNGDLIRYYLHTDDAANNIVNFIQKGQFKGIYHLVGNEKYSIKELVSICENVSGKNIKVNYDNIKPWENINFIDDSKIKSIINVEYQHNLKRFFQSLLK